MLPWNLAELYLPLRLLPHPLHLGHPGQSQDQLYHQTSTLSFYPTLLLALLLHHHHHWTVRQHEFKSQAHMTNISDAYIQKLCQRSQFRISNFIKKKELYLSSVSIWPFRPFLPAMITFWRRRGSRPSTRFLRLSSPSSSSSSSLPSDPSSSPSYDIKFWCGRTS